MENFQIRFTEQNDLGPLLEWLNEPEIIKWFPMSTKREIEDSAKNWIGFSKFKCSLSGVYNNETVAIATLFLMPYKKLMHHSMFYLVVDKKHQRKGIGSKMLEALINLAKEEFNFESIYIEIFEGCPAASLLEKFKFTKFATQPMFVKEKDKYLSRTLYELIIR